MSILANDPFSFNVRSHNHNHGHSHQYQTRSRSRSITASNTSNTGIGNLSPRSHITKPSPGPSSSPSFPIAPFLSSFTDQTAKARVLLAGSSSASNGIGSSTGIATVSQTTSTTSSLENASSTSPKQMSTTRRHRKTTSQNLNGNGNGHAHEYANGNANGNGVIAKEQLQNGHVQKKDAINGVDEDEDERKKAKKVEKIDWEIPRKALHSSIGFLVIYLYTSHTSAQKVALVLSGTCAIITSVDFVRLRNARFARFYESMLGFLMRDSEKTKTNGVIWYLLGCIFVLSLYPQDIAVVSILVLSWCDTTASFFGRLYGRYTRKLPQSIRLPGTTSVRIPTRFAPSKSVAGFIACGVTGALIAVGFWGWLAQFGEAPPSLPEALAVPVHPSAYTASSQFEQQQEQQQLLVGGMGSATTMVRLAVVAVMTGLIAAFSEAADIGSLDDNLTLPILTGGVMWAVFRCIDYLFSR